MISSVVGNPGPHPGARRISRERFIKYHRVWAQEIATRTRTITDLFMADDGSPRVTIEGWPMIGEVVATYEPQAPISRASSPAVVAAAVTLIENIKV